jgi:hypothetical protein
MAEIDWRPVDRAAFQKEDRDRIALLTATVGAQTELAEQLLLDPLPQLIEGAAELDYGWQIDESWTVSLGRVNAEEAVGLQKGPRKVIAVWVLLPLMKHAHGVAYRVPADSEQSA